jgi:hypothetical protein
MPLMRAMARTAVVAGTATAVSNRVSRRQYNRWSDQAATEQQQAAAAQPQYVEAAPEPAAPSAEEKIALLKEIAELHDSGILSDAEFEVQKAKILNS